jgi:hypothetical protein
MNRLPFGPVWMSVTIPKPRAEQQALALSDIELVEIVGDAIVQPGSSTHPVSRSTSATRCRALRTVAISAAALSAADQLSQFRRRKIADHRRMGAVVRAGLPRKSDRARKFRRGGA